MPSLRSIRSRIRSVKNTRQITKAMEMVASAKMRKAQQRVLDTRPYAEKIYELMHRIAAREKAWPSPFFEVRTVRTIGIVLISTDRGLCGAINSNLFRTLLKFMKDRPGIRFEFVTIGRKGRDFVRRAGLTLTGVIQGVKDRGTIAEILPATQLVIEEFAAKKKWDEVWTFYTQFESIMSQKSRFEKLLPIAPDIVSGKPQTEILGDYLFEPDRREILDVLIPRYFETVIFQRVLENFASEYSARMVAMKNATANAKEVIYGLTLTYNKLRQANITKEISEISSGAEAIGQG
ncbi:MAG: ATP synthase F1 subunit gamma [Leptospirales bacterium]